MPNHRICIIYLTLILLQAVAIAKGDEDGANIIEKSTMENNLDYVIFAKLLNRLLCIIFIIIYVVMFIRLVPS